MNWWDAPPIGDPGTGAMLVGAPTNPLLYLVTILAVCVMCAAMLIWVCEQVDRGE